MRDRHETDMRQTRGRHERDRHKTDTGQTRGRQHRHKHRRYAELHTGYITSYRQTHTQLHSVTREARAEKHSSEAMDARTQRQHRPRKHNRYVDKSNRTSKCRFSHNKSAVANSSKFQQQTSTHSQIHRQAHTRRYTDKYTLADTQTSTYS